MAHKEKLHKKAARFRKLFTSPIGMIVLRDLEEELNPEEIFNDNPHRTSYNAGKRDAFIYIKQLIRYDDNARRRELEG